MSLSNNLKSYWKFLEKRNKPPTFITKINILDFSKLRLAFREQNIFFLKNIARKMYKGEAFILRKAASKNLRDLIINLAKIYDKKQKPSFFKMYDGSPNFHRIIDKHITKKYSLYAIKHSYFFYNWNAKSKLEKKFKKKVYHHWRYVKLLAGNKKFQFEKNIPSENQIDRLQIVNYPNGGGELRDHVDPRKNQRIVSGLIMSKKGEDFKTGGFYFRDKFNKRKNIEDKLEIGDSVLFYGSVVHGVEPVDPKNKLDWKSYNGRWFVGMFVNDSDHVENRITAKDLTGSIKIKKQRI